MSDSSSFLSNTPPHIIRLMTLDDIDAVCEIDREAFETYRRQHGQLDQRLPQRTTANMEAALNRPFPGVIVEWPAGRPAGYCFTHIWGSVGWLGTLGVEPRKQGFGLGKAVIAGGLDLLRRAGCETLALETMPESGKNLALYTRLGLEIRMMTLLLRGELDPAPTTTFDIWHEDHTLRTIMARLLPGLDPAPAAHWMIQEAAGETVVWYEGGEPAAFAILRSVPRRTASRQAYLTVELAACVPEAASHWLRYLGELHTYARRLNQPGVLLPVNARQTMLLNSLLNAGMQIVHTRVRMARGIELGGPDDVIMLTLAM